MTYPLKVIVVKAHPDEAELYAGGTCARLADKGAAIKFLSLTNGDAGHYEMARKPLKRRRAREAYAAARHLGVLDYEILDIHDGELMADIAVRTAIIASVRRWQADLVITFHDEQPGHIDNRMAGRAVRDASGFFTNGNVVPAYPPLAVAPVCLKMTDYGAFATHQHEVVVDVDASIERKLRACAEHATQFFEFAPFERDFSDKVPASEDWAVRREFILTHWHEFMSADVMREEILAKYGPEHGSRVAHAESFQLADYGRHVDAAAVHTLLGL
ncbi:PIG-L deacetylase family protein [Kaistia sp. MMO-174]|uniref:PIG-L deacetylase family protein n=1 Tax=Kaistia sp. MMO-174 TaxID=3081256 RepID=UPI0030170DA7